MWSPWFTSSEFFFLFCSATFNASSRFFFLIAESSLFLFNALAFKTILISSSILACFTASTNSLSRKASVFDDYSDFCSTSLTSLILLHFFDISAWASFGYFLFSFTCSSWWPSYSSPADAWALILILDKRFFIRKLFIRKWATKKPKTLRKY